MVSLVASSDRTDVIPYYQIEQFSLGPVVIHTYGLFVGLGFAVGLWLANRERVRRNLDENIYYTTALLLFVGAIVGARLLFVFSNWSLFSAVPSEIIRLWHGGLSFSGGIVGALVLAIIYLRNKKVVLAHYLDAIAAGFPLAYAVGRIGCNMIKDHWGRITTVPWAVSYQGQLRHDNTMYEILIGVVLFVIFWPLRKKISTPGRYATLVFMSYAALRLWSDVYRATDLPASDPRYFGLTVAQYFMIVFLLVGASVLIFQSRHTKQND